MTIYQLIYRGHDFDPNFIIDDDIGGYDTDDMGMWLDSYLGLNSRIIKGAPDATVYCSCGNVCTKGKAYIAVRKDSLSGRGLYFYVVE